MQIATAALIMSTVATGVSVVSQLANTAAPMMSMMMNANMAQMAQSQAQMQGMLANMQGQQDLMTGMFHSQQLQMDMVRGQIQAEQEMLDIKRELGVTNAINLAAVVGYDPTDSASFLAIRRRNEWETEQKKKDTLFMRTSEQYQRQLQLGQEAQGALSANQAAEARASLARSQGYITSAEYYMGAVGSGAAALSAASQGLSTASNWLGKQAPPTVSIGGG